MARISIHSAVDALDANLADFLGADLPVKAITVADLASPGMSSLVTAAKQAASLQRTIWTVKNGRGSVLDIDPYAR